MHVTCKVLVCSSFACCLQVKDLQGWSVQTAQGQLSNVQDHSGPLLRNYTITPGVLASVRAPAASVFGANQETLTQAKGQ